MKKDSQEQVNSAGLKHSFQVSEVGRIKSVQKFIVFAQGMPNCLNGQMVEFYNGVKGLVIGFLEDEVQILVLGSSEGLRAGSEVYNRGEFLEIPVGEKFLGRVVDSLCGVKDDLGPIEPDDLYPVFRVAPGVMDRIGVEKTLETGTLSVDATIPIGLGQRQLIIGDRLTGKTAVAIDAVLNQRDKETICIYCCTGKPYSSLLKVIDTLRNEDVMRYCIVVNGIASASAGEQYLSVYTAATLGEYFMHRGKDVLVIFDDLTRHAWVYRQISLLLNRAPGREAYPGDIFYLHSQLMERAGQLKPELKEGSMTFLPVVEVQHGDVTGYISTNIISMTDGQIYFSTQLFNKGFRPAVDLGLSVSRIGSRVQWPAMKALSRELRLQFLQYRELLAMTTLRATSLSADAEQTLKRGKAIAQLLIQPKNKPISMEEQIIYLYALSMGSLDSFGQDALVTFKETILLKINQAFPDFVKNLRASKIIDDSAMEALYTTLAQIV